MANGACYDTFKYNVSQQSALAPPLLFNIYMSDLQQPLQKLGWLDQGSANTLWRGPKNSSTFRDPNILWAFNFVENTL